MIFPNPALAHKKGYDLTGKDGIVLCPKLLDAVANRLAEHGKTNSASSTHIARAIVLSEPASLPDSEITAKGNLNFQKILTRRAKQLELLYTSNSRPVVKA